MKRKMKKKPFPMLSNFMKENKRFLTSLSTMGLIYNDVWESLEHYHRGDLIPMHEGTVSEHATAIKHFLYY